MNREAQEMGRHCERREPSLARKAGRMGQLMHRYHMINARNHGAVGDPLRGQGRVLALLAVKPETTQRELSYLLDMRQQSLSEILSKLEEKGYITREKSEQDGRVTVIKLTVEGAAAAPSPDQMERNDDSLDCLTDDERTQFEALIDKVIGSLEEKLTALGDDPRAPHHRHHGPHAPHGLHDPRGPRDLRDPRGPRNPRHGWNPEGEHLHHA